MTRPADPAPTPNEPPRRQVQDDATPLPHTTAAGAPLRGREPGIVLDENLAAALQTGVPLRMQEIREWTPAGRANDAAWVAELMRAGASADELLYGQQNGRPAAALAALVRALAALAYQEGGVTVAGLHWCASPHIECPTGPQWAHLNGGRSG